MGKPYIQLPKTYYTPGELGEMLGVSRQTIVLWIRDKRLPATRTDGGHWRIPADVVKGAENPVQIVEARG